MCVVICIVLIIHHLEFTPTVNVYLYIGNSFNFTAKNINNAYVNKGTINILPYVIMIVSAPPLYQGFLNPYRVCSNIVGACDDPYQLDTCETCPYWLEELYSNILREGSIAERVEFLKVGFIQLS